MAIGAALRRRFWSGHARTWDELFASREVAAHYGEIAAWLSEAISGPARLLDLGCGTGTHALVLAEQDHSVVGVDFAPGMLARAAEKAQRRGFTLELRQADLDRPLPFAGASFDGVMCSYVLQVVARPVEFLREVRRVMRPGAVAVIEVPTATAARRASARPAAGRAYRTLNALGSRLPGAVNRYDPARLRAELTDAGLTVSEVRAFPRSSAARARS